MGKRELIESFKNRSLRFIYEAEDDLNKGWYDFAVFHAEQSLQLALKALIAEKEGSYPLTHDLRKLIDILNKYHDLSFIQERYSAEIDLLIQSYISSRYLPIDFNEGIAKKLILFVKEVLKRLGIWK